jgi:RHS repeat-associated protein
MKIARKGFPRLFILALLSLAFFFLPTPSPQPLGHTLYVNRTDPTCGGKSPCFAAIQAAVDAALPADTIQIQPGTYPEQLTIQKNDFSGATESDRVVIEADPAAAPGNVVLTGAAGPQCTDKYAIRIKQSKFITIRGFTIHSTGGEAISLMGGNNQNQAIHIERNRIFDNGSSSCNGGITIARGNPDTLIVNNLIYANGRNGITFIDADGGPHYIVENTIHGNQWSGVNVARSHVVFLVNNVITRNGTATGTTGGRFGVSRERSTSPDPAGIHLLNNLICGNRLGEISGPALDASDSGNLTPTGSEGSGVAASPGCEIPSNVYLNVNGVDGVANTADDDFNLASHSPAIDRGMDPRTLGLSVLFNSLFESAFANDAARPADGDTDRIAAFDIGAFEFPNNPPIADAGADQTTFRGVQVTLNGNLSHDLEGASLAHQWTVVSEPQGSAVSLNNPTSTTPTFTPFILGSYLFQLVVGDGDLNSAPDTVQVNVVNRAPTGSSAAASTDEDTAVIITLTASDDTSGLSYSIVDGPSHGTLGAISAPNCIANGAIFNCVEALTYTPDQNYSGSDSFAFKADDGNLDSNVATVSITINSVNDAPVAANDFYNIDEDMPLSSAAPGVLGNDNDVDTPAASLTAILVVGPSHTADFTLNSDGSFFYTPAVNFSGTDTFTYKTNDGSLDSNVAMVTITVNSVNDAPVATNDFYNTDEDVPLEVAALGVLANDNDVDTPAANLTAVLVSGPAHAAIFALNADGSFSYTPETNFNGTDTFTYKANDGTNDSNVAMVTIAVNAIDDAPVAQNDTYNTNEDSTLIVDTPGVLANDNDIDTPPPSFIAGLVSGPSHASAFQLSDDGSFSYTAESNFNGVDTFTYRVFDGALYSDVAMVQIAIASVNDAPVAQNQSVTTNEDTSKIITLSASDIDSPSLSFTVVNSPSHGTLGIVSAPNCAPAGFSSGCAATVTYTPTLYYFGPDNFTFKANDGNLESNVAMVNITIIHVNHAPTANAGGPYSGTVGIPIQFSGSGSDPDGYALTFNWDFGDGFIGASATPAHTYASANTFAVTLTVTDPFGAFATSQTTATVAPAFQLNPIGNKTVNLGETLTFTVTVTNSSGAPFSLFVDPLPLSNHATFNASTGVFTFTPDTTQVGSFQLNFTAVSGNNSSSETITITVPNPPPGGTTSLRGLVYNLNQTPLENVKVTLKATGNTTFSTADGYFTVVGVPSGHQEILINGRDAKINGQTAVHAILAQPVDLIDGVLNNLANPITLPDVDITTEVQVSQTFNTIITSPNIPGVQLEILGGSATNADGTPYTDKLSINPVPDYGRPESRPIELRPGMAVTIQPAGVRFNPPTRITFPNTDNMLPGMPLDLWSLSPDTGTFSIVGTMEVSADGQSIITVDGGVVASAWHFPLARPVVPQPGQGNTYCKSCRQQRGSEADVEEGSLYLTHAIPSYRSLGQSRSVSLTYSSITTDVRPIVTFGVGLVSVPFSGGQRRINTPITLQADLEVGGVKLGETFFGTAGLPGNDDTVIQISMQFDGSNLSTGRYPYKSTAFSNYQNSAIGAITNSHMIIVEQKNSSIGRGWAISDLHQLHFQNDGILLNTGDGSAFFFSGGPDVYTSPAGDFTILVKNGDGTYTRAFKDGTRINFNAQGLQTSVVDRNANATSYSYDGNGRLLTITDAAGLITTFTYSGGRLQSITDPAGRQTALEIDSSGNLVRITNPDGTFSTYAYNARGQVTQATDERSHVTTYAYDFAGRFFQSTKSTGETRGLTASKIQGLANLGAGIGTATNPAPPVLIQNATASLTDGNGHQTKLLLNSLGQIASQTDALANTTVTERDSNGLPTKITRPNGAVTTMTYDAKGNLLTSTDPVGAKTTFTYDPSFNQVKTIRDPKGNLTTINYDLNGNPVEIIDALGNRTQMTYDSRGLLASTTSAVGQPEETTTSFTYDSRGNLLTTTDPLGNVTTLAYDNAGNVFRSTDAESRITEFTYDAFNRLSTVLDPNGGLTRYSYDAKGNLTQVIDAKNQTTTFAYNELDRLVSATNPLGLSETFTFDNNGNLSSTTNRNGQTIIFDYDAVNRLMGKTRPPTTTETGLQTTTFQYDSIGNLATAVNPTSSVFNLYDLANRLASSTSTLENSFSNTITQITDNRTIADNNFQFDAKSLQVSGKTLTVNGSHTFENLILVNGAVLTHSPTTATKVNKIDITVVGTLQIDATSKIDVTGKGFLPGTTVGFAAGSSGNTGGGYGGLGGGNSSNPVYGDFRNPNDPGSGGGSAGTGGGLVRIVAQTVQLDGSIKANGGNGPFEQPAGSGGGIRVDAGTIRGAGTISANGGDGGPRSVFTAGSGGGGGRVAIYYQDATGFDLSKVNAFGGNVGTSGGAGTIYLQGPTRENGELIIDNNNLAVVSLSTPIPNPTGGTISLTHFRVRRQAHVRMDSILNLTGTLEVATSGEFISTKSTIAGAINLNNNGLITHLPTTATASFKVDLSAGTFTIDATSKIDVTNRGFLGGGQLGNPFSGRGMTVGFAAGSSGNTGGGYGGLGGGNIPNPVYGDFRNPNDPGSGAGTTFSATGNGGGLIRIVAQTLQLDGSIKANGGNGAIEQAAGSGGGIRIDAGTISGAGTIAANGGDGGPRSTSTAGNGGGGGRVAIYYQDATGFDFNSKVSAFGGDTLTAGGAGTVYLQGPTRENGELVIDNSNLLSPGLSTPVPSSPSGQLNLTNLRVRKGANPRIDDQLNLTGTLEVSFGLNVAAGLTVSRPIFAPTVTINNQSFLTHLPATGTAFYKLDLHAANLTIDATSRIGVGGRGFLGANQSGNPFTNRGMTLGFVAGSSGASGGGYGGLGGAVSGSSNAVYGSNTDPNVPGSGGAASSGFGGNGGGIARIVAQTIQLDGLIRSLGGDGTLSTVAGGGSGGAIRIDVGTLNGSGQVVADGGNGGSGAGGGGGGRIAIYYQSAPTFNFATKVSAHGGTGAVSGQNGTIFIQQTFAMLTPTSDEAPVMKAGILENEAVQLASLSILAAESSELKTQSNLYLALAAGSSPGSFLLPNPKSKIENQKLDDVDPIYSYDLNGNRATMIDPTGLTTYEYDALNRLTKITNNKGVVTTFTYDALGRRKTLTHGNGVVTSYAYDAASQLLSLAHKLGATTINSFNYTYDKVGNRKTKVNRDGNHNYTYDTLNRLVEAINPLPTNPLENYTYDPVGNRTDSNQNGLSQFNTANELNEDGDFTYQYDNNGNMTRKTAKVGGVVTNYEYDAENKLVRAVMPSTTVDYKYDGLGRRIEKDVIASTTKVTRYIYDNEDILLELDGSNGIVARYTHGPGIDEPLVMEKAGANFFYHADGLGSITDITNQTGSVVQRYSYLSFGEIESQSDVNFVQPYTFTAREFDAETGLYFYRARTYDWGSGRFNQEDPILHAGNPDVPFVTPTLIVIPSLLLQYTYVENSPINFKDPQGLFGDFAYYGNWCGPGWTGGRIEAYDPGHESYYKTPIDQLDTACRKHDICYFHCRKTNPCDRKQRSKCMTTCDRALAMNASVNGPRSIVLYTWMGFNVFPQSGSNKSCGCTTNP